MDSLHLFTIPKWLPYNIPPELWAIIFCWKWRLELKDIHKALIKKTSTINTSLIDYDGVPWLPQRTAIRLTTGNYWFVTKYDSFERVVGINEKCGIELLNWSKNIHPRYQFYKTKEGRSIFRCEENLQFHLKENLGIICPKNTTYLEMIKLLRTV